MGSITQSALEHGVDIHDIRTNELQSSLRRDIHDQLNPANGGEKKLPTLLLYDEKGLQLFEKITYLEEYYPTNAEIELLTNYAASIADRIPDNAILVELGSGNLRKVNLLLQALDKLGKSIDYYALDLSLKELQRTLSAIPSNTYKTVRCHGLHGTYEDGLVWLSNEKIAQRPQCILSLGSSIGNFSRPEAVDFLRQFTAQLKPTDMFILGVDNCTNSERVYHAYNDKQGLTHQFVLNGLDNANTILGQQVFDKNEWYVTGEYDKTNGRHHAFVSPRTDVTVDGVLVKADERVRIEESYKYSAVQFARLLDEAGLTAATSYSDGTGTYGLHLLTKPKYHFSTQVDTYAKTPVPSRQEFGELWDVWDLVTRHMIPTEQMLGKPIKLRNCCIFYLGHIPTFLDMKLTEFAGGKPTDPEYFTQIFERGIDPDVDNPEQCHSHSEIPNEWPELEVILDYQKRVRMRVCRMYRQGVAHEDKTAARALWLGFEHEVMHLETLLYMLLESEYTVPPVGPRPDFAALAAKSAALRVENSWFDVPEQEVTIGTNDPEKPEGPERYFVWDVERPQSKTKVPGFKAQGRCITVSDYIVYLLKTGSKAYPVSWIDNATTNGNGVHDASNGSSVSKSAIEHFAAGKSIKTIYGPIPLTYALDWPVQASYNELSAYASHVGGRIPTFEETLSIYEHSERTRKSKSMLANDSASGIPGVNGHLSHNGVAISPPQPAHGTDFTQARHELFCDLTDCNVGFKAFHPTSISHLGNSELTGRCEAGGVWEWTSTSLAPRDGYLPMKMYPAYSSDFFDGKHNIILGGSWATHPRVAGRKSFVNWYQKNYPFVWAGARVVMDN